MNVQIRPGAASLADYGAIASIHNAVWQRAGLTAENRQRHDGKRNPNFLFQRLLVERAGQIIAHAAYGEDAWNHTPGKYFMEIEVHPAFQQQGGGNNMINPKLQDKVILITGANHGIGAAIARAFADQGAKVFITFYRPPTTYSAEELAAAKAASIGSDALYHAQQQQDAAWLVQAIGAAGGTAIAQEMDLADPTNIPRLFDLCEAKLGAVDVLVNNHTFCVLETFDPAQVSTEQGEARLISAPIIDKHFAINTRAYALLMAEYVQRYLKRGATWGRIINISTDAAHAHSWNVSYAASKHAIESYSRSAAAELGKYGINVNIVAPGPIQTGYIIPEAEQQIRAGTPLGDVGKPEHIADVVVFLASEQARWLTGQLLYVGGGWRMSQ